YVANLHSRLQVLGFPMPTYTIDDDPKGNQRFRGLIFVDAPGMGEIEVEGVYPSKKRVKEELAREALQALDQAEKDGPLSKRIDVAATSSPTNTSEHTPLAGVVASTLPPVVPLPTPVPVPVPAPVAFATSATTQNVSTLVQLLQKHALQYATFNVVPDPPSSSSFVGSITVPGVFEGVTTPPGLKYPSKKHAKEYLAGIAIKKVNDFVAKKEAEEEK